ncbi:MAG: aspartate aminotransferase family protein, partial [Microbacteriaceae bacterium]|nr:aspartate aminotransferase family protein [Microbacteriaceae bacterium]
RYATPAAAAIEERARAWILDLLGLPATSSVGFTTGGTMANFVGLASGRGAVLEAAGWNVNRDGLTGAPGVTVLAGAEVHSSVGLVLRYLGLGEPTLVASDDQGRIRLDALADALETVSGPVIVALQAGNLHSGAFGLWATASPRWAGALDGLATADSWATDAHKTPNVPYDCGVAIVARAGAAQSAFTAHTSYFIRDAAGVVDPMDRVPELSRRSRGIPVWAALRSLGRSGTVALIEGLAANARSLAEGLSSIAGVEVLNDVVFTQISVAFGSNERTRAVTQALIDDGVVYSPVQRQRALLVLQVREHRRDPPVHVPLVGEAELDEHRRGVLLDRRLGQVQLLAHRRVGATLRDEGQHIALPVGEIGQSRRRSPGMHEGCHDVGVYA